jgi:cytochrome b6-f complex iron-sulfur subunit
MDEQADSLSRRQGDRHGESAEQVEDYLRLEEHIAQLQSDRRPRRPRRMSPAQARIYQMAALFRSAAPDAAQPDPAFAARLYGQLQQEVAKQRGGLRVPRVPSLSRRNLLAGGIGIAAAAAGAAVGVGVERSLESAPRGPFKRPLVVEGAWEPVVAADALPVGAVYRFVTEHVVGFVRHTAAGFEALSGACTHMGCLVGWNSTNRTFDCPCHGGVFLENGNPSPASPVAYRPLPAIRTKVEGGKVWVYLPAVSSSTPTAEPSGSDPYPARPGDPTN